MNERIVALDVGDRRIGIAVSDALGITAQPIETYTRVGYGPDVRRISQIAQQYVRAVFRQKRSRSWQKNWRKSDLSSRITTSA